MQGRFPGRILVGSDLGGASRGKGHCWAKFGLGASLVARLRVYLGLGFASGKGGSGVSWAARARALSWPNLGQEQDEGGLRGQTWARRPTRVLFAHNSGEGASWAVRPGANSGAGPTGAGELSGPNSSLGGGAAAAVGFPLGALPLGVELRTLPFPSGAEVTKGCGVGPGVLGWV